MEYIYRHEPKRRKTGFSIEKIKLLFYYLDLPQENLQLFIIVVALIAIVSVRNTDNDMEKAIATSKVQYLTKDPSKTSNFSFLKQVPFRKNVCGTQLCTV